VACNEPGPTSQPAGARGGSASKPAGAKGKGKRKGKPTAVAVQAVTRGAISSFYETTASLQAERTASVLARAKGVVQAISFEEGDTVKKGQVLLRVDDADLKLGLEQAKAKTAGLQDRFQRLKELVAKDLAPVEELETVTHDLRSAQAEQDLAQLTLSRTRVRAPFTGTVVQRLSEVGQSVDDSTPVFELADLDPLLARVHVPSKEFKRIARDQPVRLTLDSSGTELSGRIKLVSPVIDPDTGTIKVMVEISEYPPNTRPGDFAQVRIVTERRQDRLLVPRVAVMQDRGAQVAFVVKDGSAHRKTITTGFEQDKLTEVLTGLELGASVVIKGQHSLKDGQPVQVLED